MPTPLFLVTLHYCQPLAEIDRLLEAHREWLRQGYEDGVLLASGPLQPRTGGFMLARAASRAELDARLALDPFQRDGVATCTVQQWLPSMSAPGLERLIAG